MREQNELEIVKARDMATIETHKFKDMVDAIGSQTIAAIATAGPEMQVQYTSIYTPQSSSTTTLTSLLPDVHTIAIENCIIYIVHIRD